MNDVTIGEPKAEDKKIFLEAMQGSVAFHDPWVTAPCTDQAFNDYLARYHLPNQKSFLVWYKSNLVGVININEIVWGCFQSAYLGFYATKEFSGRGLMSQGLKLVLAQAFNDLGLHRLEANIQPENQASILLVKKNNFVREGFSPKYLYINDAWRDHERWALLIEDWKNT